MMNWRGVARCALALAASGAVGIGPSHTAEASESGASFLKIDPSPRTFALGGSNSAISMGAEAMSANPANMGQAGKKYEAFTAFSNLIGNEQYSHLALALNRATTQRKFVEAIGFSFTNLQSGSLEGRDRSGNKTSSFSANDRALAFSASTLLKPNLRMGLTGRLINSEIAGYKSGMTLAADLGLSSEFRAGSLPVNFGVAARNLGRGISYIGERDSLPTTLDAGFSFGIGPALALLGASHLLNERQTHLTFGMEFGMGPLALRAGYRSANEKSAAVDGVGSLAQNFSTGIGLKMGSMRLDYAMSPQPGDQGISHRGALTLAWGGSVRPSAKRQFIGPEPR